MRRRASTGGKPLKAGRRKATAPKRPNAQKAARPDKSPAVGEETEVARLRRELNEALEQQAATSEVLSVINSSPGDLKPVFEAMLENAVRLCEAKFGFMARYDGDAFHVMAQVGAAPAYAEFVSHGPMRTGPETILGQVLSRNQAVQIPDLAATRGYAERSPMMVAAVELGGVRTYLAVPMFKENKIIGAVLLYRQEVRPFNDKQVALLTNFAAQAVIAIENTRLLSELRESLEQQTATSEVLKVISSSPGELEPVFQAMLANAVRICDAKFGVMFRYEGTIFHRPHSSTRRQLRGLFSGVIVSAGCRETESRSHVANQRSWSIDVGLTSRRAGALSLPRCKVWWAHDHSSPYRCSKRMP